MDSEARALEKSAETPDEAIALAREQARIEGGSEADALMAMIRGLVPLVPSSDRHRVAALALEEASNVWPMEVTTASNRAMVRMAHAFILFSYGTPVAASLYSGRFVWCPQNAYSSTSRRHVNAFLRDCGSERSEAREVSPRFMDALVSVAAYVPGAEDSDER